MKEPKIVNFNKIGSLEEGFISIVEQGDNAPFEIKRVYWTYFTPNHVERGRHSHKELEQIIVAVSGIIHFKLENIEGEVFEFRLDSPNFGLYIPPNYWREIKFSHNAVLMCLASQVYDENDYIRDYDKFKLDA